MGYCTEQILIQFLIGFIGSLFASGLIALVSDRWFKRTIKATESTIVSSVEPLNKITRSIASEIKTLAVVVDKLREGLEKKL
jgi:hypothetical protein